MSYRNYLYEINNTNYLSLKNMSVGDVKKVYGDDGFVWLPNLVGKCIFEYGSQNDFDVAISKVMKPLFVNKETHEYFNNDQKIGIVYKNAILITIEIMRKEIVEMYKKYSENPILAKTLFENRALDWDNKIGKYHYGQLPYNLYKEEITDATHYEYIIFELVRLYKTFDLNNKTLVYMGY